MPSVKIDDTLDMHYEVDNFVEPWRNPETILLVHGVCGSTAEWFEWMPHLSGKYAVVRVDLRGWGRSSVPPEGYAWSMDNFAGDLVKFMDRLGLQKVHLVGTKMGGRVAIHFARDYPQRLHSMTMISTPMTLHTMPGATREERPTTARGQKGLEEWARATMVDRIGNVEPARMEWWIRLYSSHSPRVVSEVFDLAWGTDETANLAKIKVPVLVIDSQAHKKRPLDGIRKWQSLIPDSRLAVIPVTDEGRMISVSKPAACAAALLEFLDELPCRK